eukprot:gene36500-44280_t
MRLTSKIRPLFEPHSSLKLAALPSAAANLSLKTSSVLRLRIQPLIKFLPTVSGPCLFLALQASSLGTAMKILRKNSVGKLSLVPFASLTLNCLVWSLYGYLRKDYTVLLPNASGFLVGQLSKFSDILQKKLQSSEEIGNDYQNNRRLVIYNVVAIIVTILLGGVVLMNMEGWTFIQGVYFALETSTTIGYGDLDIRDGYTHLFVGFYIIFSTTLFAMALNN